MLATEPVVAFVATADPSAATAFYRDRLGLRLAADTPFALVFDAGGTELRVQKVASVTPAPQTCLGWAVGDIVVTIRGLVAAGVAFARFDELDQDPDGVWDAPGGARIAWFRDPDGNLLSLTQHPDI